MRLGLVSALLVLCSIGCDPDDPGKHDPGDLTDDSGGDTDDTGSPPTEGCRATPQDADRDRLVMVSFPYGADGSQATTWRVFTLDREGALADSEATLEMGRGYGGHVAFTPDGSIGMVAHDDGTLGVFEAVGAAEARVIHARLAGDFYASAVVSDPSGESAWIIDGNWPNNGGGLYRAAIDCDSGEFGPVTRVLEAKLPAWLGYLHGQHDRALLVGREAGGANAGEDAFLIEPGEAPAVLAGADLFGDDEAIFAGAALSFDDATLLVGDNSMFSGVPNRIAVGAVTADGIAPLQVLENIDDPIDIVASAWGDRALVLSGFSDALLALSYEPGAAAPYRNLGELSYTGGSPELPTAADQVTRGPLKGLVVLTENQGLRRVRFEQGAVTDLGRFTFGSGLEWIPGAIGVQP